MVNNTATRNCALTSPFDIEGNKCKITNGVCPDGFKFKDGDCVFKDLCSLRRIK